MKKINVMRMIIMAIIVLLCWATTWDSAWSWLFFVPGSAMLAGLYGSK